MQQWLTWREAAAQAMYGAGGFYRRPQGPRAHFRTSVHVSSQFADAVLRLLLDVDAALGCPAVVDFVDLGAGHGELCERVLDRAPAALRSRLRVRAVEVAPRPAGLPPAIDWTDVLPRDVTGLVLANEWLDDVPADVATRASDGPRLLLVDAATGEERLGPAPPPEDRSWLESWWPLDAAETGDRAEIGRPRDEAWAEVVASMTAGVAVAIDYAHSFADRSTGMLSAGTLTGYRGGRAVAPIPDGSCNVTCHVALDACAAAGVRAGAGDFVIMRQREALQALGVGVQRPDPWLARTDPAAYLQALERMSSAAELTAMGGLGDFGWLVQSVGVPMPEALRLDPMRSRAAPVSRW